MSKETNALVGCLAWVIYGILMLTLGGYCTQYCLEFWINYAKSIPLDSPESVQIPFWICCLLALIVGPFTITAALVTYILSAFALTAMVVMF